MNNKDFDDALKKKLESVSFEHISNAEVDKVMSYVQSKRSPLSKRSKRFTAFAAVLVACMLALIGLNIYQLQDRQQLGQRIDSLQQATKNQPLAMQHDTIYIHDKTATISSQASLETNGSLPTQQPKTSATHRTTNLVNRNAPAHRSSAAATLASVESPSSKHDSDLPPSTTNQSTTPTNEMSALPAIPDQNSQERNEVTQPATNKLHDDSAATIVIHPTPAPADNDTMDAGAYQEEKKSPAFFSKLTAQVGIASTFFPTKMAVGLLARLNLSSRWGIQAGIDKSHYARVRFHDEDDFRNGRREDFRQSYALADTQKVTNIDIQYSCVQVPLHVLYKKELTKNFHVIASLGTTLDLRVKEVVNYRRPSNAIQDSPNPIRAERNVSTPTFNNAQLSAGVEFSIRKLTLSIAPTYSYQVSNVAYQKYKSTLGGSLRMLYTL